MLRKAGGGPVRPALPSRLQRAAAHPPRARGAAAEANRTSFFDRYGPEAREVLDAVLEKYAEHGSAQFVLPDVLEVPPFNEWGNVIEIAARFGGRQAAAQRRSRAAAPALRRLNCRRPKLARTAREKAAPKQLTTAQRLDSSSSPPARSCARTRG